MFNRTRHVRGARQNFQDWFCHLDWSVKVFVVLACLMSQCSKLHRTWRTLWEFSPFFNDTLCGMQILL